MNRKEIKAMSEIYHYLLSEDYSFIDFTERKFIKEEVVEFTKKDVRFRFFKEALLLQRGDSCFDRWGNSVDSSHFLKKLNVLCLSKALNLLK